MLIFAIKTTAFLYDFQIARFSILRVFGDLLGVHFGPLGSHWGLFGPSLAPHGASWAHLGLLLGLLGALLAP